MVVIQKETAALVSQGGRGLSNLSSEAYSLLASITSPNNAHPCPSNLDS
jgi:hypothetical protein